MCLRRPFRVSRGRALVRLYSSAISVPIESFIFENKKQNVPQGTGYGVLYMSHHDGVRRTG